MKLTSEKNGQRMEKETYPKEGGGTILIAYKIEFKAKNYTSWGRHKIQRCWQNHLYSSFLLPWKKATISEEMQERRGHSNSTERLEL